VALEKQCLETRDQVAESGAALRSIGERLPREILPISQAIAALSDRFSIQAEEHGLALSDLRTSLAAVKASLRPPAVYCGEGVVATEVEGLILGIPAEEWRLAAYHLFRGVPEPGLACALQNAIQPGMVIVDVGANIGLYTLIAARLTGYSGKVISFEPSPRIFALLRDNVQVNGFLESGIIDLRQVALSDSSGVAPFTVYPKDSGHSTLFRGPEGCQQIEVQTDTLDRALSAIPKVDVIKIDAEGAEPFILRGMRETLKRNPRLRLFIEFAPPHLQNAGVDPSKFLDELAEAGFEILAVDDLSGETRALDNEGLLRRYTVNLSLTLCEKAAASAS
jgi:FkbM family methyltransferase